ncbi:protein-L-isoaspartate(D-aspartate) O-methyltransferase [Streptacidiphilus sp. PB12-B1b]|nr:protein-L-isoaspartate(D-aspartate) O-methyltransferase [Streptacidiphilus sp. PB12-B1b]
MDWEPRAAALADEVVHPSSPWHGAVAATPRHLLVPRWWRYLADEGGMALRVGADDPARWLNAAYSNRTLVTRVGSAHADAAGPDDHPEGLPTSSSTLPALVLSMFEHALITDTTEVLCVTGSGYGTALLARRLGDQQVTSVDVDPYLVRAASGRLDALGLHPTLAVCDLTGPLPGRYDRIVSTVGLPGVPASWLAALRDGGRLVTNLAGTGLVVTADKAPDGSARGRVTWERAGFMATRSGDDYPPSPGTRRAWTDEGEEVGPGRYPVVHVAETWELLSAFALTTPGVQHGYRQDADGVRTAVMVHADGSWARATGRHGEPPTVHQAGPRRLWDVLDGIRHDWLSEGALPGYGAAVTITPDGRTVLSRGGWRVSVGRA